MTKVITYQAPNGDTIRLTLLQVAELERNRTWPRNRVGEEYCQVSHGAHHGVPDGSIVEQNGEMIWYPQDEADEIVAQNPAAIIVA